MILIIVSVIVTVITVEVMIIDDNGMVKIMKTEGVGDNNDTIMIIIRNWEYY